MRELQPRESSNAERPKMFDKRITLGNVLTMITMAVAGAGAYWSLAVEQATLRGDLKVQEMRLDSFDDDTKRRLQSIEGKLDRLLFERGGAK